MGKQVACVLEGCAARVAIEDFEEGVWLPVFKATREHWGFCCPDCARRLRAGELGPRLILSRAEGDEIVIDMKPLAEEL